jgi:hypothetical protein
MLLHGTITAFGGLHPANQIGKLANLFGTTETRRITTLSFRWHLLATDRLELTSGSTCFITSLRSRTAGSDRNFLGCGGLDVFAMMMLSRLCH